MRLFSLASLGTSTAFLVSENFEGTGTPSGWTTLTGTPNYDYTTVPLEGSQSLYLSTAAAAHRAIVDFTSGPEYWIYFLLRITNGSAPAGNRTIGGGHVTGSTTVYAFLQVNLNLKVLWGTAAATATALSLDTTYHVWLHIKKGTGTNGIVDVGFSTNGVRPTSGGTFSQDTANTGTSDVARFSFGTTATNTNVDMIYDKVRIATSQIGDNGT